MFEIKFYFTDKFMYNKLVVVFVKSSHGKETSNVHVSP